MLTTVYYNIRKLPHLFRVRDEYQAYEGSTGSNELSTQPHRHKEGLLCWISTFIDQFRQKSVAQSDEAHEL